MIVSLELCNHLSLLRLLGNVKVGNCVYVGSGALILPGVEIGDNSIVGAGAVVTKNLKKNSKVKVCQPNEKF